LICNYLLLDVLCIHPHLYSTQTVPKNTLFMPYVLYHETMGGIIVTASR